MAAQPRPASKLTLVCIACRTSTTLLFVELWKPWNLVVAFSSVV